MRRMQGYYAVVETKIWLSSKKGGSGFYWYFLSNMGMETGVFLRFLAIFVFIRSLGCTNVTNPHLARTPLEMAGHLLYQGQRKTH